MNSQETRIQQKLNEEFREFKLNVFNYLFDQYLEGTLPFTEAITAFQEVMADAFEL